jgi:ABC-type thiamine transport system substrate-binding protein
VTAQKQSEKLTSNRVYTYQSFSLKDSLGSDVTNKLSSNYKDSIAAIFDGLARRSQR